MNERQEWEARLDEKLDNLQILLERGCNLV